MSVKQVLTAEQLWARPETPGERYELVGGELIEVLPAGALHGLIVRVFLRLLDPYGLIVRVFLRLLDPFVLARDLGEVFADGVGYIIRRDPDIVRIPDASFVSRGRIPAGGVPKGFWPFAPDLAVEIVSPGDTATELRAKVREYLDAGTRLVWVAWPDERAVTVYGPAGEVRELGPDDALDGADVLPGFRVRVAELFRVG